MSHYLNDLSPEDAQAEAFRIMATEAGLVARMGAPLGTVKDGWPCLEYETYYRKEIDPETAIRLQLDYRLGIGHVKRKYWQMAEEGANFPALGARVRLTTEEANSAQIHLNGRALKTGNECLASAAAKIAKGYDLGLVRPSEVLAAHAEDAITATINTFENWASDFGMDTDSRKAERMYNTCRDILPRLLTVLSVEQVERLAELRRMF